MGQAALQIGLPIEMVDQVDQGEGERYRKTA